MNLLFYNECEAAVSVSVDSGAAVCIAPQGSLAAVCENADAVVISVGRDAESNRKKGDYTLVLATEYRFSNIKENEAFHISGEKIRAGLNVYYERLLLTGETARCEEQTHRVAGERKIKKRYQRARLWDMFLIDPFLCAPGVALAAVVGGIVLLHFFGWKPALILVLAVYVLLLAISWSCEHIVGVFFQKAFHQKSGKKEFYRYFEKEFIEKTVNEPRETRIYC